MSVSSQNPIDLLRQELGAAGWPVARLQMIHRGATVVLHDDVTGHVVRVAATPEGAAEELLQLHIRLEAMRAPVLAPASSSPVVTSFGVATLWPAARPSRAPHADLGRALRQLHAVEPTAVWSRPSNRQMLIADTADLPAGIPDDVRAALERHVADLPATPSWTAEPQVLVHGDAHAGNVMIHHGQPVLIDLERVHHAPAQIDLVPTWAAAERNGSRGDWSQLSGAYGAAAAADLAHWEHLAEAVRERELATTVFLARQWSARPDLHADIRHRLDALASEGRRDQGWSDHSPVLDWWRLDGRGQI